MANKTTMATRNARIEACAIIAQVDAPDAVERVQARLGIEDAHDAAIAYVKANIRRTMRYGAPNVDAALDTIEDAQSGDRVGNELSRCTMHAVNDGGVRRHRRDIARVLSQLYVQIEETADAYAPDAQISARECMDAETLIAAYYDGYIASLTPTVRTSLRAILRAGYGVDTLMTSKLPEVAAMRARIRRAYTTFPARDTLTCREYIGLALKYAA